VFPAIINEFPAFNELFGVLFFVSLVLAGLTSLISICETFISGLQDKFNITRGQSVLIGGGLAAIVSLVYATQGGMYFLDAVDYFINQFGVAVIVLVEDVFVAWILRKISVTKKHADEISEIKLGSWWVISIGLITPIVIGYMMIDLLRLNLSRSFDTDTGNYEGYSDAFINLGWTIAIGVLVIGIIIGLTEWETKPEEGDYDER